MSREELIKAIEQNGSAAATLLREIFLYFEGSHHDAIGDLADLKTDHKSSAVEAINELFGVIETPEMEISMLQTNAQRKAIFDECALRPSIAKNIVFYNVSDAMYYRVNGYNIISNVLYLHTIMQGESGTLRSVTVQLGSNGALSVI